MSAIPGIMYGNRGLQGHIEPLYHHGLVIMIGAVTHKNSWTLFSCGLLELKMERQD